MPPWRDMPPLTDEELNNELTELAYSETEFQQLIKLVWALPDSFWTRVAKRLIATSIVGILRPYPPFPYPNE